MVELRTLTRTVFRWKTDIQKRDLPLCWFISLVSIGPSWQDSGLSINFKDIMDIIATIEWLSESHVQIWMTKWTLPLALHLNGCYAAIYFIRWDAFSWGLHVVTLMTILRSLSQKCFLLIEWFLLIYQFCFRQTAIMWEARIGLIVVKFGWMFIGVVPKQWSECSAHTSTSCGSFLPCACR